MITLLRTLCLLLAAANTISAEETGQSQKSAWPAKGYSKVVGYSFKIPERVESGFSLISKDAIDPKQLTDLTIKSAELTPDQVKKLEKAAFSTTHRTEPAACYDPHHIFVFYAKDGTITNAIEVCFSCTGVATLPKATKEQWYHHDFVALAYLTEELGLWQQKRTAKAYEKLLKERQSDE